MPTVDGQRFPYTKEGQANAATARRRRASTNPTHRPDLEGTPTRRRPPVEPPAGLTHPPAGPAASPEGATNAMIIQQLMKEFQQPQRRTVDQPATPKRGIARPEPPPGYGPDGQPGAAFFRYGAPGRRGFPVPSAPTTIPSKSRL